MSIKKWDFKKKNMKIKLLLLFVFIIVFGNLKAQNFAIGAVNYTITNTAENKVSIASGSCYVGDLILESTVENNGTTYTITKINTFAFANCTTITSIEIPNSVTSVGTYSFFNCTSLSSVNLPDSITKIEDSSFNNTGIEDIILPNSIRF